MLHITGTVTAKGASSPFVDVPSRYSCPMYKAPKRTGLNFITSVDLKTEDAPSKWVLRGVALLTTTDT